MRLDGCGATDLGRKRHHNDDSIVVDSTRGFFMVADGVGGARAGHVASKMVTEIVHRRMVKVLEQLDSENAPEATCCQRAMVCLQHAIIESGEAIFQRGSVEEPCRGMSTTALALQITGSFAVVGHVGDSRLYLIRSGTIYQLTEDHTLVQILLSRGALTPEEALVFPNRDVIDRVVGRKPTVEVDSLCLDVVEGDSFVLCSDGLSDRVSDAEIKQFVASNNPKDAAGLLVARANELGGHDNASVIVVKAESIRPEVKRMQTEQKVGLLREVFLFRDLSFAETVRVLSVVKEERYPNGHQIIREDERGDTLHVLLEGEADVTEKGVFMTRICRGGHFGELGLLGGVRSATVTARGDTALLRITRDDLFQLIRSDHGLAIKLLWRFLQNVGDRMKSLSTELAHYKARGPR